MNTNLSSSSKAFACAVAALLLTVASSYSFFASTQVARVGGGVPASVLAVAKAAANLG